MRRSHKQATAFSLFSALLSLNILVVQPTFAAEPTSAPQQTFEYGPVFSQFGKHAPVKGISFARDQQFKVAFDVADGAVPGELNRRFDSLARFINMHVANGVKLENLHLALVVHGSATLDTLQSEVYLAKMGAANENQVLLKALMDKGVNVVVCGQSAAAKGVESKDLISGINVDLSAMTAHARLAQDGFSINPF